MNRRTFSIRTKLTLLLFLGVLLPIGAGLSLVVLRDIRDLKRNLLARHQLVAAILADHSAASLAFEDTDAAQQTLATLGRLEEVLHAGLLDAEGRLFVAYRKGDTKVADFPPHPGVAPRAGIQEGEQHFDVIQPVSYQHKRYGTLYLRVSLAPLESRTRAYMWSVVVGALGLGGVALAFALVLQRLVMSPLRRLAIVAGGITAQGDYSLRAPTTSRDEVGLLAQAFNIMVGEVERRDLELRTAQRNSDFLAQATAVLAESLDLKITLSRLAHLVVPYLGDWCVIDLVGKDREIERLVGVHADPAKEALIRELREKYPPTWDSPQPAAEVLRSRTPLLVEQVTEETLRRYGRNEEHIRLVRELDTATCITVPLVVRERVLGALTIAGGTARRRYGSSDLELARELARRAGLAVDNARHYGAAQEAISARDTFVSMAAHELRTPLTPLQLQIQTLEAMCKKEGYAPDRAPRMLAVMERQVGRLTRLVNQLLDMSRLAQGRFALVREVCDLREVVREVVDELLTEFVRAGCEVHVELASPAVGSWDRIRIAQVVINLLTNALKFGHGRPIGIRLEVEPSVARLVVSDQGVGVEPEAHARIFEPFERGVSERQFAGLGLGLYITRQIVQAHGGAIAVDSQLGAGATFVVTIPRGDGALTRSIP